MARIIDNLEGYFIATVYNYNITTRELDVFIPKLMPMIPEGQKEREILTNFGNRSININYNNKVKLKSTIKVKAKDANQALPNKGSKVLVQFYDGEYTLGFWEKFNTNNDYDVIEEEKYPKYFYMSFNDKKIEVNLDDEIVVKSDYEISLVKDDKDKTKTFTLLTNKDIRNRIAIIENELKISDERKSIRLNSITNIIEELNNKIKELETKNSTLTESLTNMKNENDLLKNEISILKNDFSQYNIDIEKKIAEISTKNQIN